MKPEYVMLAQTYDANKHSVAGWLMSIKYDGIRAIWDGGMSRGKLVENVPYANYVKDKDKDKVATGLWSRGGKVIYAPGWFLDKLPTGIILDGELIIPESGFQELASIVLTENWAGEEWDDVQFMVFDSPQPDVFLSLRKIKVRDYEFEIRDESLRWWLERGGELYQDKSYLDALKRISKMQLRVNIVGQHVLPDMGVNGFLNQELHWCELRGQEGVMLRNGYYKWSPYRCQYLLKYKVMKRGEGRVCGYKYGLGKHRGRMGALILELEGNSSLLKISGFTDYERDFQNPDIEIEAWNNPGAENFRIQHPLFRIGDRVKFTYRDLTNDLIPKEARYQR